MKSAKLFLVLAMLLIFVGCSARNGESAPAQNEVGSISTESGDVAVALPAPEMPSNLAPDEIASDSASDRPAINTDDWLEDTANRIEFGDELSDMPMSEGQRAFSQTPDIRPRMMTAGEWNDNENHGLLLDLMQTNQDFRTFEARWQFNLSRQIKAVVADNGRPVNNAQVELLDINGDPLFVARTNNRGVAYLFVDFVSAGVPTHIRATSATSKILNYRGGDVYEFELHSQPPPQGLDLMFVIDATGSMGDEMDYLKVELTDIIRQVNETHANLDIRLSIIVYRDVCCDFVVRTSPFSRDINSQVRFLEAQYASGGGDWEEAVEQALAEALEQDWRDNAAAKLMFLVLDAPPHNRPEIRDEMHRVTMLAAEEGVRIIPVTASGIDSITEFLMRALSAATGGTYVFITGHSGIGYGHIDPTVGAHDVQLLNELLVDVINRYV